MILLCTFCQNRNWPRMCSLHVGRSHGMDRSSFGSCFMKTTRSYRLSLIEIILNKWWAVFKDFSIKSVFFSGLSCPARFWRIRRRRRAVAARPITTCPPPPPIFLKQFYETELREIYLYHKWIFGLKISKNTICNLITFLLTLNLPSCPAFFADPCTYYTLGSLLLPRATRQPVPVVASSSSRSTLRFFFKFVSWASNSKAYRTIEFARKQKMFSLKSFLD